MAADPMQLLVMLLDGNRSSASYLIFDRHDFIPWLLRSGRRKEAKRVSALVLKIYRPRPTFFGKLVTREEHQKIIFSLPRNWDPSASAAPLNFCRKDNLRWLSSAKKDVLFATTIAEGNRPSLSSRTLGY